ncbi:GyrI-like domain-containing protein [Marimonas arenosa]|uniref:GyrI-like domain-containing protein n=1 Tax=Marimonas arenosa TaxID=1795305 RepID=A0AAE4B5X3_9RHOB|nr:GyrI-like domain-containing protein [Marimonas arenosa]MDQ2089766.1 GyrI-like domain-containing protein [Marimonas arenosa]
MTKLDFKKTDKPLYTAPREGWARVQLPGMTFLMIDGQGDPNGPEYAAALKALYPMAYGVKFAEKDAGRDFAVPPLEALWWADDMTAFVSADRAHWRWTAMLRVPDAVTSDLVKTVRETVATKQAKKTDGADPDLLRVIRLERFAEGDCLQRLHLGPYTDEAPVLADLHDKVMPGLGLTFGGKHHEIYLSDPRRVAPEKLRTILRQPVKPS